VFRARERERETVRNLFFFMCIVGSSSSSAEKREGSEEGALGFAALVIKFKPESFPTRF
jgi:L,D-peptidoglycan transpeptidase YkuD (ErfK/YbiS/YcfS/YnhG family)